MSEITGVECESAGEVVVVRGDSFHYKRVGNVISLHLGDELTIEDVYLIKEVIELYEELISVN